MSRTWIGAALALLALALLALPGGSSGDSSNPTWAGVWDTDFGRMTLGAGGSGTYEGFTTGTISGHVDGLVDEGTWQQGDKKGDFRFTMSGLSFTGEWHYDTGGCGSACGWSGTCTAGPCLENDDPPQTKCPSSASASASPGRVANQQDAVCGANEIAAVKPARDWGDTRTTPLLYPDAMALLPSPIIVGPLGVAIFKVALKESPSTPDDFSTHYLRTILTKVAKGKRKAQCLSILVALTQDAFDKDLESYDPDLTLTLLVVAACLEMAQELDAKAVALPAQRTCARTFGITVTSGGTAKTRPPAKEKDLRVNCRRREDKLRVSVRPRSSEDSLREIVGRRLDLGLAVSEDAPGPASFAVRWRARKR